MGRFLLHQEFYGPPVWRWKQPWRLAGNWIEERKHTIGDERDN
jgi:hypothetical protein